MTRSVLASAFLVFISFVGTVFAQTSLQPRTADVGEVIRLDPTDGLQIPLGGSVSFAWAWLERPATSVANFSDATALRPEVTIDVAGRYVAQVSVRKESDPTIEVATGSLEINTGDTAPVAAIIARGLPEGSSPLVLDGSRSIDLDGGPLTYSWSVISAPTGSAARIALADQPLAKLLMDVEGTYVAGLTVTDAVGQASELATFEVDFLPNSGSVESYRLSYDETHSGVDNVVDRFELGDRSAGSFGNSQITGFEIGSDALSMTLAGTPVTASTASEFYALVDILELDNDDATNVRMSPNVDVNELTFIFGGSAGAVTIADVIGSEVLRTELDARGVDVYEGVGGRQVGPEASARFDQLTAEVGEVIRLEPYASTDIDGSVLVSEIAVLAAPSGASTNVSTDIDGMSELSFGVAGEYLVSYQVSDGLRASFDQVLVLVGQGANVRPVARMQSVTTAQVGTPVELDGTQSYDLDGDLIQHRWSLLYAPEGSVATIAERDAATATFTPDVEGDYVVQMEVADAYAPGAPTTQLIRVAPTLPVAEAGPDRLAGDVGQITLDGTLSSGANLTYGWASLGLTGDGSASTLNNTSMAMPELSLAVREGRFRDVIKLASVYHFKRSNTGNLCQFDTRMPANVVGSSSSEPISMTLHSRGQTTASGLKLLVWEIENKSQYTREVRLEDQDGNDHGSFVVPGRVSVHVTTVDIGKNNRMYVFVGNTAYADDRAKINPFNRNNPVCTGPGAGVVQLIVKDGAGLSVPDTAFVGNTNLRPVLLSGPNLDLISGQAVDLSGAAYGSDPNGNALTYSWSLISRPDGSSATIVAEPATKKFVGSDLTFAPDRVGSYLVQVEASDGELDAVPVVVRIEVLNSPPVAVASGPAEVFVGESGVLSGAASSDIDGDALTYLWTLTDRPDAATFEIADRFAPTVTFSPDRRGDYVFELVVSDYEFSSDPATVVVTAPNRAPVAVLSGPGEIGVGDYISLDASASTDPDHDPLSYSFSVLSSPPSAGFSLVDLGGGQADFSADTYGEYIVEIAISDGLAESRESIVVTVRALNTAPVLGELRSSYIVELGLELALDLTAQDPDGDPISFFASPLPLVNGMSLSAQSGEIRFRPETGQLGSYTFVVGASDGALTDEATITVEVVAADAGDTGVYGRVLDAKDFDAGVISPLPNMTVRLRDAALMTVTDGDGLFRFNSLSGSSDLVTVEPSAGGASGGYLGTARPIKITENQIRDLAPDFLLVPLEDGCATVVAGQMTELVGTNSGVNVSIPADSIQTVTGEAYQGQICLGSLPEKFQHSGFPKKTNACKIYALDAPGAVFTQDITVTAPNLDNLPETTRLGMWRFHGNSGKFSRAAIANVDPGAVTVSGKIPTFGDSALFTFLPQQPSTRVSASEPNGMQMLTPFNGDNATQYTLPGYTAFGQTQQIGLSYHSRAADPSVTVSGDVTIKEDASLPVTMSTSLNIGGLSISDEREWTPRLGLDGRTPALIGEAVTLSQSAPVDGSGLASGRYEYDFTAVAGYGCSTVSSTHRSELFVQNEKQSPYGKGWSVSGLQKLVEQEDGSVTVLVDGGATSFKRENNFTQFDGNPVVIPADDPISIAVADFDGDGAKDLAIAESTTGDVAFIRNFGDRDFDRILTEDVAGPKRILDGTSIPKPDLTSIVALDMDRDGIVDLPYTSQGNRNIGTLFGDGFFGFDNQVHFQRGNVVNLVVADIDADGYDDVIFGGVTGFFLVNPELRAFFGGPDGFTEGHIAKFREVGLQYWVQPIEILADDIDGDGRLDVVMRSTRGIHIAYGNGGRSFTAQTTNLGNNGYFVLAEHLDVSDVDGDGDKEIFAVQSNGFIYYPNNGGRSFGAPVALSSPPGSLEFADFHMIDVDNKNGEDILFSHDQLWVYASNGDGTFAPGELCDVGHDVHLAFIVDDMDGDGEPDLVSMQGGTDGSVTIDFSQANENGALEGAAGEFSTLKELPDGTWQRIYKDGTVAVFNSNGLQTAVVDPRGNRIEYAYDSQGRLISKTDQVGGVTTFTYASTGLLSSVSYPDGRVTTFDYDASGHLIMIDEPIGSQVSFAYDENGRLVNTTNQNGNATFYTYDGMGGLTGAQLPDGSNISNKVALSLGLIDGLGGPATSPLVYVAPEDRVTTVTDRKGQVTEVVVNQFGSVVQVTDPLGRVTKSIRNDDNLVVRVERPSDASPGGMRVDLIDYDFNGNVSQLTEAAGAPEERTTAYTYETVFNKVLTMTDPDGFITAYEYDDTGLNTKTTDPEGGTRNFTYEADGKLASRTDENGNTTAFTYNALGNLETTTYADGSVTALSYDTAGNTIVISEAQGTPIERQVQRSYDAMNRVLTVEVTGADGAQIDGLTSYTYLPAGNLATVTDATGLVTSMSYDAMERLVAVDDPAEGLIQRVYNVAGEVTSHINGDGETHNYTYDEVGRLTKTVDPGGFEKSFAYNAQNSISTVTDGRGGVTRFGYDALDRMTTRTNPLNETMTRSYDARGNLLTLTREDGLAETASYDGLGRRTSVVTPDNTLSYAYDARSNLTEAADNDSRVTFAYDLRNRLSSTTTDGTVGLQPQVTLSYTYDALDRRTAMSDSLGGTTSYAYDPEDRLTDLTAPWGTVYSFGYDGEGRRTSLTSTSGRATTYGYTNGLLTALSHAQSGASLTDLEYQYGPDGQLTAILDKIDPLKSRFISYDDLNRLVQVDQGLPPIEGGVPVPVEDYAYDEEGNRTASHLSALYSSNAHNQLEEDEAYSYAYDPRGNRVSKTSKATGAVETYAYDSQNRLVGYSNGTTTARYAYDALDRRVAKTVDGETTAFVLDQDTPNPMDTSNIVLEFGGVAQSELSARWLFSSKVDEPLEVERYDGNATPGSGESYALLGDHQGSISTVVNLSAGIAESEHAYHGYGTRTGTGSSFSQPYGCAGREYDVESGLYHLRWRAYDPQTGTFMQMDPLGFGGGQENLYAYVNNDPFNATDPMGLTAYFDYKTGIDGRQQAVGEVTRNVSSGVFSAVADMIQAMNKDWNLFAGSVKTVGNLGPGSGGKCHGNSGHHEGGQHIYVIYSRSTGQTAKVGIGKRKDLILDGALSKRAMKQIAKMGGPTKYGHTVLMIVPGGLMSRAQALVMEKMMVTMLSGLGMPVEGAIHQSPTADPDKFCPFK